MTDREIMQQAFELLKQLSSDRWMGNRPDKVDRTILALEVALAQPEQEPVAWMVRDQVDGCRYPSALKNPVGSINGESQPLYTAPPKREWVGLTIEEIKEMLYGLHGDDRTPMLTLVNVVEAKLKEKNT